MRVPVVSAYAPVLRTPGALRFSAAGFVARMPISMLALGIVLLISRQTGSYGLAGAVSAAATLASSVAAPLQARLSDRYGQARVLRPLVAAHAASLATFLFSARMGAGAWLLLLTAAAAGATLPQIGALVRARWAALYTGTPRLHIAYALESVLDEGIFVLGPVVVTVLATQVDPLAGLAVALLLSVVGGLALAAQRGTEPPPQLTWHLGRGAALPVAFLAPVGVVFAAMGSVFGTLEVAVVAVCDAADARALAGPLLAVVAVGSLLAGLVYGSVEWRSPAPRRFLLGQAALAASVAPLPFAAFPWGLAAAALLSGLAIAPTLVTGFALVESQVPPGRLTEALAWTTTALGGGVALGAGLSGWVIDAAGAPAGFFVALGSGVVATVLASVVVLRSPRRAPARATTGSGVAGGGP